MVKLSTSRNAGPRWWRQVPMAVVTVASCWKRSCIATDVDSLSTRRAHDGSLAVSKTSHSAHVQKVASNGRWYWRLLQGSRTDEFDISTLKCGINASYPEGSPLQSTIFDYYYAIGITDGFDSMIELRAVDSYVTREALEKGMVWCVHAGDKSNQRMLQNTEPVNINQEYHISRSLSIVSVHGAMATVTEDLCPASVEALINSTGSSECIVVKGSINVVANVGDNVDYLIASLRDALQLTMEIEETANVSTHVAFLHYLGDEGVAASSGNSSGSRTGLIFGLAIPLVLGLLALGMFSRKEKRSQMTAKDYHEMMNSNYVLVGTADPPGSYHEGMYHTLSDGTCYLSTRCEGCFDTRRRSLLDDLGVVEDENETEVGNIGLGGSNERVDVHKCKSATCLRCQPDAVDIRPTFVPATPGLQASTPLESSSSSRPVKYISSTSDEEANSIIGVNITNTSGGTSTDHDCSDEDIIPIAHDTPEHQITNYYPNMVYRRPPPSPTARVPSLMEV